MFKQYVHAGILILSMALAANAFAKDKKTTTTTDTTSTQPMDSATTQTTTSPDSDTTVTTSTPAAAQTTTSTTKVEEEKDKKKAGGLFLEPMIVYQSVTSNINTSQIPGFENSSGKIEGAGAGLRVGGHVADIIWLAAEGRYNRDRLKDSAYGSADADAYNYGATLGLQTPWAGIRLWGTRILGGNMNPDAGTNGVRASFTGANGYRVGGGLYIKDVALNLEYQDMSYSGSTINSVGSLTFDRDTNIGMSERGPIFSLSFPITL